MVIKSPGLAGIFEIPANLGFFLFVEVFVANQIGKFTCLLGSFIIIVAQESNHVETKMNVYTISTKILLYAGQSIPKKPSSLLVGQLT